MTTNRRDRDLYREWREYRARLAAATPETDILDRLPPDLVVCDCSACGGLCASAGQIALAFGRVTDVYHPPTVPDGLLTLGGWTGLPHRRPLCLGCSRRRKPPPGGRYGPWDDENPLQANAIRAWEDEPDDPP